METRRKKQTQRVQRQMKNLFTVTSGGFGIIVKFMFSKKTTRIDEIFTIDLTLTTYCKIDGEDFFNFCGLLRKHEL